VITDYESVFRPTTRKKGSSIDGGEVIPIIKTEKHKPQLVVIANFRAAIGKFSI
jgi:hypothetical protein